MVWTNVALADETIDGITYSLDTSTSTATVTWTPSGNVVIPATITYNNRKYNVTAITGVNSGVTTVEIPEGVTSIGTAFKQKTALTSIVIPSTVQRIENNAFNSCSLLISVTLSEGLTYIGDHAFGGCTVLPSITIPTTIMSMGKGSFRNCSNLKKIVWNAKHCVDFASTENVPFCMQHTWGAWSNVYYYNNTHTTTVLIGEEVEYIPAYLFSNCSGLSTLVLPDNVKEIGEYAFSCFYTKGEGESNKVSDVSLTSVTFGTGLEVIGKNAFYYRTKLSSITIPDKCTAIGTSAFEGCSGLSTITLGKNIATIGNKVFDSSIINTINIYATTPPVITKEVFPNIPDLMAITLNVRSKALDAYKTAAVWKDMYVQAMENDLRTFTLNVSSADESKGTTTQGGAYDEDSEILIYAAAKDGYKFSKWNDGNTENPRTVKMIGNLSFVAQFEPFIPVPTYTITASANAVEGSAVGGGVYESGTQVTLAAVGNTGYHFTQWTDGNTTNPRQITVLSNGSYTAQFVKDPVLFSLNIEPENAAQGWTTEGGAYEWGKQLMIYAHPASGFAFSQWSDGNKDNPRFLTMYGNVSLTAQFEAQKPNNINSINASATAASVRKFIRNGQTFIEYDNKTYTIQGVEVK